MEASYKRGYVFFIFYIFVKSYCENYELLKDISNKYRGYVVLRIGYFDP